MARRTKRRNSDTSIEGTIKPNLKGVEGGLYRPLSDSDMQKIDHSVRDVLENIGMSEAPPIVIELVTGKGGKHSADDRLTFPKSLVNEALAGFSRHFTLHGQQPQHDILMSGKKVYVGTGGAAPHMVDLETGQYRDSTLQDLYDAARLVDTLENVHFFSRSVVARDMPTELDLDVNTAYASLMGTTKHVFTAITLPEHVSKIAEMCYAIAGSREAFIAKPFLSVNINHEVPPLRFAEDACEVMAEAIRHGIPVHANTFGQLGASSPVTIIGSVLQNVAETLAGMIFAWLVDPNAKVTFGARPMITDLRTGAMSGGSGEQAVLMAAATQMAQYYDLPNTCIAGATDSKKADAQSGYEKNLSVTLAAQVGANAITQACGMQASLMGCALESYVIDNDMLGGILRAISPLEITEETLSTESIAEVVRGDGHFLGQAQTFQRMQSDFLYPNIADRRTPKEWEDAGSKDIHEIAKEHTRQTLKTHFPTHVSDEIDQQLRASLDIKLPKSSMQPELKESA